MPSREIEPSAVVFLHGIGGAARVWAAQVASFEAAGFAAVALDLAGYGTRPPVTSMSRADISI